MRGSGPTGGKVLLLCRTPLQASLLLRIAVVESLGDYDLLYVSQNDAAEDRTYFERLAERAAHADLLIVPPQRFDILNHIVMVRDVPPFVRRTRYDHILLASIDAPVFAHLTRAHPTARISTFDDGTENILADAFLVHRRPPWRERLYRRLLRAESVAAIHARSTRHFTVFEGFCNILPAERLTLLPPLVAGPVGAASASGTEPGPVFFLGQPFAETLDPSQIARVEAAARKHRIDWYVRHPRETAPLLADVAELPKNGEIAEDAILRVSGHRRPLVLGTFSTALFTLSPAEAAKIYLSVLELATSREREDLVRRAGCEVERV